MLLHFGKVSEYRNQLMGVATAFIICCHAAVWCNELPTLIRSFLLLGNLGVDIFLFLSGVGLYFSWMRSPSRDFKSIIKWEFKRYIRVLVPYLLISIPFYILLGFLNGLPFKTTLLNILTVSYWTDHEGAWYIAMLLPLYLVTPLLLVFLSQNWKWRWFILLSVFCFAFVSIDLRFNSVLQNTQFVISRLPCFFLGICIAPAVKNNKTVSINHWLFALILVVLIACGYIAHRLGVVFAVFVVPVLIYFCCVLLDTSDHSIIDALGSLGCVSLESYLFNLFLPRFICDLSIPFFHNNSIVMYLLTIVLGITCAFIFGAINRKLVSSINHCLEL